MEAFLESLFGGLFGNLITNIETLISPFLAYLNGLVTSLSAIQSAIFDIVQMLADSFLSSGIEGLAPFPFIVKIGVVATISVFLLRFIVNK